MEYNGVINYHLPAHITTDLNEDSTTDFNKVMEKIQLLKEEFNINILN